MKKQLIGSYVVAAVIITGVTGCQSIPARTDSAAGPDTSGSIQSITMKLPRLKMNGKVGSVQYEAFELISVTQKITRAAVSVSVQIANHEFTVVGPKANQAYAGITLIHEASRGKNLADEKDNQLFQNRLKELFALHRMEVNKTSVAMNGNAIDR